MLPRSSTALSRLFVTLLISLFFLGAAYPALALPEVAYTVSISQPWTHYLEVEMRVSGLTGKTADLILPVWTPGSYLVREYARNVQEFEVLDANDRPLPFHKISKNTWRVEKGNATALIARYRVYANVLAVQQAEVNDTHAFWNNAAILMHVGGGLAYPATLTINAPENWKVATSLETVPGTQNSFRSPHFDILYDSPVEVGTFTELRFEAKGKPHRIILTGKGNYDPERLTTDLKKIVEAQSEMFGGLPYNDYTFLVNLRQGGGGLEHLSSTALIFPPFGFRNGYRGFLTLASHEYFHLWNVKRIRPDALGPFDYSNENYTRSLWVAEGITSYYENVFVRRAGLMSTQEFLQSLTGGIARIEQTPGRKVQSLEDASFDAWIKYYRPDENSVNSQISYYTKGEIVGMLLDLTIRQRSNGARSLDDVMRTLYNDFALKKRNYTPQEFQRVCETVAGSSLEPFFASFVRGTKELDYDTAFAAVGLKLRRNNGGSEEVYLGARFTADPAGIKIDSLATDTPAYEQGMMVGDILIAIDGLRINAPEFFNERLREKKPGDTVSLTFFRGDQLKTRDIKIGGRIPPDFGIISVENPTDDQKRLRKAWLGADLDGK